jgi:hypothetical protein
VAAVATVLLAASPVFAGEVVYAATLKPTDADPSATGQAVWSLDTGTGGKRLTVAVQNVQSTYLARAFVSGRFVGFLLIAGGSGELDLDSLQGDTVPYVPPGAATSSCARRGREWAAATVRPPPGSLMAGPSVGTHSPPSLGDTVVSAGRVTRHGLSWTITRTQPVF